MSAASGHLNATPNLGAAKDPPKRSILSQWFTPEYDYSTPGLTLEERQANPRYVNGRLKLWEFQLVKAVVALNLILVFLSPLAYWIVVPKFIQYKVDHGEEIPVWLHELHVGEMQTDSIPVTVDVRLGTLAPLPINVGFKKFTTYFKSGDETLATFELSSDIDFWLNHEPHVLVNGKLVVDDAMQASSHSLIKKISSPEGVKDFAMKVEFSPALTVFGFTIYPEGFLELYRDIPIGDFAANSAVFLAKNPNPKPPVETKFEIVMSDRPRGAALRSNFNVKDIMTLPSSAGLLGDFELIWNDMKIEMTDTGVSIIFIIAFENHTPIALAQIEQADLYFGLEDTVAFKGGIRKLGLVEGLNNAFHIGLDLTLVDPLIDHNAVQNAIEKATKNFADNSNVNFSILGPVTVSNADFISKMTEPLEVKIALKDILNVLPDPTILNSPPQLSDDQIQKVTDLVKGVLGSSKIEFNVLAEKITGAFGLQLPVFDFLKPPSKISFPYHSTISIYGDNVKAIQSDVTPIEIVRQDVGVSIDFGLEVLPQNNDAAATGLANSINPVLAVNPTASSIGIKDLAFFPPNGTPFKWCTALFGERVISIGLPAVNKEQLLELASSDAVASILAETSQLVKIGSFDIAQLTDRPGFGANGNIAVSYPEGLPELKIELGYFHMDATVESADMAALELPSGLQFYPRQDGTKIDGALVLSRNAELPVKVQRFVDALLKDGALPSYTGVTGLKMGASGTENIITFSKIAVDVSTDTLVSVAKSKLASLDQSKLLSVLEPGMVRVLGADFAIVSQNDMEFKVRASIKNPTQFSLSVGATDVTAILDESTFMKFQISPLKVGAGSNDLAVEIGITAASGAGGVDDKVANLVDAVLKVDYGFGMLAGVTGIKLTPTGGSASAVIDQIEPVKAQVKTGFALEKGVALYDATKDMPSSVDVSALLPKSLVLEDILKSVNPVIKGVKVDMQPKLLLMSGADLSYNNPLPITVNVPYVSVTPSLDSKALFDVETMKIMIAKDSTTIQPEANVLFKKTNGLPDALASFVTDFFEGSINTALGVSGVHFGISPTARNSLFAKVSVNVTPFLKPVASKGPEILANLGDLVTVQRLQKRGLEDGVLKIDGPYRTSVSLVSADVAFQPGSKISTGVSASFSAPLNVDVNMPYFGAVTSLDELRAVTISGGFSVKGSANAPLKASTIVAINDIEELENKIALIGKSLMNNAAIPGKLIGGGMIFGVSSEDSVDLFSKLGAGILLDKALADLKDVNADSLIDKIESSASSASSVDIVKELNLSIAEIAVMARPKHVIEASAKVKLGNKYPVTLSGLGIFSTSAGLDEVDIVNVGVSGISISKGQNDLGIASVLEFPSSSTIKDKVRVFTDNVLGKFGSTSERLAIGNTVLGFSKEDHIRAFRKLRLSLPSKIFLNQKRLDSVIALTKEQVANGVDDGSLLEKISFGAANLEFTSDKIITAGAKAGIPIPFDVKFNMPVVQQSVSIFNDAATDVEIPVASINLSGLEVTGKGTNNFNFQTATQFYDGDVTQEAVGNAINGALSSDGKTLGKIATGKILLGIDTTPENVIDTFSTIMIKVKLEKAIDFIKSKIPASTPQNDAALENSLKKILTDLDLKAKNFAIAAKPARILKASAETSFKNGFNLTVSGLDYITASAGIDRQTLVDIVANGPQISSGQNDFNVGVDLGFKSNRVVKNAIATFVRDLSNDFGNTPQVFSAEGVSFGVDAANAIGTFKRVRVPISSKTVFSDSNYDKVIELLKNSTSETKPLNISEVFSKINLKQTAIELTKEKRINADLKVDLELPFGVSVDIPFFEQGVSAYLDNMPDGEIPLTSLSLSGLKLAGTNSIHSLDLNTAVQFFDNGASAAVIGSGFRSFLRGTESQGRLGVGKLAFGVPGPENQIDVFSEVMFKLRPSKIRQFIESIRAPPHPDADTTQEANSDFIRNLLQEISESAQIKLGKASVATQPGSLLKTAAGVEFQNAANITLKGFNVFKISAGINGKPDGDKTSIFSVLSRVRDVQMGGNNFELGADIAFSKEESARKMVGQFTNDLSGMFGATPQELVLKSLVFGREEGPIEMFKEIELFVASKSVLNDENWRKVVDLIKNKAANTTVDSDRIFEKVKPLNAQIEFTSSQDILAGGEVSAEIPFDIAVDIQSMKISAGSYIPEIKTTVPIIDTALSGLKIDGEGNATLSIGSKVTFHDRGKEPEIVARLINSIVTDINKVDGTLAVYGTAFGVDTPADIIDVFAEAELRIPVQQILNLVVSAMPQNMTALENIDFASLELPKVAVKDASLKTLPARIVEASVTAAFNLPYPISVKGLGHSTVSAGLDDKKIMGITATGIAITPGDNELNAGSQVYFHKDAALPLKIKNFVDIIVDAPGTQKEKLSVSDLTFGPTKESAVKLFSLATISIDSSLLINNRTVEYVKQKIQESLPAKGDGAESLPQITVSKLHAKALESGVLSTSIGAVLKNATFSAVADIGYARASAIINRESLMDFGIMSGLHIKSQDSNVALNIDTDIKFYNEESVQNSVAVLVDDILAGNNDTKVELGGSGVVFGFDSSDNNLIDTFSLMSLSLPLSPFMPIISKKLEEVLKTLKEGTGEPLPVAISAEALELDVQDEFTLVSDFGFGVKQDFADISIDLPYVRSIVDWNQKTFVDVKLGLGFQGSKLSGSAVIHMPEHRVAAQSLFEIAGSIIFFRGMNCTDNVAIKGISFGFSEKNRIDTFSRVAPKIELGPLVDHAVAQSMKQHPVNLNDLTSSLEQPGFIGDVTMSNASPLKMKAKVELGITYWDEENQKVHNIGTIFVKELALPLVNVLMVPDTTQIGGALAALLPELLAFTDFASPGRLGYVKLIGSNGKIFGNFDQAYLNAPEITFWEPIVINVIPKFDLSDLTRIPLQIAVSFPNNGPWGFNLGTLKVTIQMKGLEEYPLLEIFSEGPIKLKSVNEGAGSVPGQTRNFINQLTILARLPLPSFDGEGVIKLLKALISGNGTETSIKLLDKNNVPLPYITPITDSLIANGAGKIVLQGLGVLLAHVKFELAGIPLPSLDPFWQEMFQKIADWFKTLGKGKNKNNLLKSEFALDGSPIRTSIADKFIIIGH